MASATAPSIDDANAARRQSRAEPAPEALRFEPMRPQDLQAIEAIERLAYAGRGWTRDILAEALHCGHECWVAIARGRPIGHAVMAAGDGRARLLSLCIHPSAQRRGHGAALARQMIQRARERDAVALTLEARPSNTAAQRLYAALGFRKVGCRKGFYRSPNESACLLELRLDS